MKEPTKEEERRRDELLLKLLKTPPKPRIKPEGIKSTVLDALDALALALASHDHQWTDKERQLYEAAITELTSGDCTDSDSSA